MELDENVGEVASLDELGESPLLGETVLPDTELKTWLVNYVGMKSQPDGGQVTVEMIVEKMAEEFPEFVLAMAEENWVRGYHQAMTDVYTAQQAQTGEEEGDGRENEDTYEETDEQNESDEQFDEE